MGTDTFTGRLVDFEVRIQELEAHLALVSSVVAALQPLRRLLARYGVSDEGQREIIAIINDISARLERGEPAPFTEFEERVLGFVSARHRDQKFFKRLIEALRVERPAAKRLCDQYDTAIDLLRT